MPLLVCMSADYQACRLPGHAWHSGGVPGHDERAIRCRHPDPAGWYLAICFLPCGPRVFPAMWLMRVAFPAFYGLMLPVPCCLISDVCTFKVMASLYLVSAFCGVVSCILWRPSLPFAVVFGLCSWLHWGGPSRYSASTGPGHRCLPAYLVPT